MKSWIVYKELTLSLEKSTFVTEKDSRYWWWYYCTLRTVYFDHTRSPLSLDLWACKLTQAGSRAWWMITYLSCWELQIGTFFPENKFPIWKWIFIVQEVLLKQEDLVEMRKRDDAEEKSRSFWLISKYFHNVYRSGNFFRGLVTTQKWVWYEQTWFQNGYHTTSANKRWWYVVRCGVNVKRSFGGFVQDDMILDFTQHWRQQAARPISVIACLAHWPVDQKPIIRFHETFEQVRVVCSGSSVCVLREKISHENQLEKLDSNLK